MRTNRKKFDLQRRQRRHQILWFSIAAVVAGYFAILLVFSERGLMKLLEVGRTHRHLTEEIQRLEGQNEELRRRAQALKNDPDEIEAIARQELGLAKKGELIYQFQHAASP